MTPRTLAGGRYVLEDRLGVGGMALVVRARDTELDRNVAVKLLADHAEADPDLRERFLREGRFAAQLSHPNVVAVYDSGEEDGQPYIVMECVEGASLAEELHRRGPLPPAEVIELARQACSGLDHAHARGVVHRDVKPQNLLLRVDGTLKVADFGIARSGDGAAAITEAGTILGTAAYMAPEVVQGGPATPASDVYSLGAVLYELLAGSPPRGNGLALLATAVPPLETPGMPPELAPAIMRCLDPDPNRRPASAADLARELEPGSPSELPTQALRTVERTVERTRPDRRIWVALGAIATAAVMVALARPDGEEPARARVEPVPAGATAAETARNLADWLRANAR